MRTQPGWLGRIINPSDCSKRQESNHSEVARWRTNKEFYSESRTEPGAYLWVRNANNLHTDLMLRNDGARSESSPRGPCVPPAPCEFRLKQVGKKWNFGIYDIF